MQYNIKNSVKNKFIDKIASLKTKRALVYNLYYRDGNYFSVIPKFNQQVANLSFLLSPLTKHGNPLEVTKSALVSNLHERQIYTLKSIGMIEEKDRIIGRTEENEGFVKNGTKYYRFTADKMFEIFSAVYL